MNLHLKVMVVLFIGFSAIADAASNLPIQHKGFFHLIFVE